MLYAFSSVKIKTNAVKITKNHSKSKLREEKMKKGLFALLLMGTLVLSSNAFANSITYEGSISATNQVDYFYFSLTDDTWLDLQLETSTTDFDPVMYLFVDDGDLDFVDLRRSDDDDGAGLNSLIDTWILAGDYVAAISDYRFTLSEAISGVNPSNHYGNYSLFVSSDYGTVSTSDVAPVPEPSTWILLGSGLAGLALYRRKRNN